MLARWKLGGELAKVGRGAGRPDNSGGIRPNLKAFINSLNLAATIAKEMQRLAMLPSRDVNRVNVFIASGRRRDRKNRVSRG